MERRRILIFTVALISGAATLGSAVQAAPLPPIGQVLTCHVPFQPALS